MVVCVVVVILDARSAWSSLLVLLAGLLDGLLGVAWCCLMACLVLLGVAWCCLVVVLGCGWITGLMADRWLRAGGWVFVGGACSSCVLAGGCWLAWCCLACCWLAWCCLACCWLAWCCLVVGGSPGLIDAGALIGGWLVAGWWCWSRKSSCCCYGLRLSKPAVFERLCCVIARAPLLWVCARACCRESVRAPVLCVCVLSVVCSVCMCAVCVVIEFAV